MRETTAVILLFALLALISASCQNQGGSSGPARKDGPHFDHAGHLGRGLDCTFCHGEEDENHPAMPSLDTCMECHQELDGEKPEEKRAAALFKPDGTGRWVGVTLLDDEIIFPHLAHVKAVGDCLECHRKVAESEAVPSDAGLSMDTCLSCHQQATSPPGPSQCASCHQEIRQDRPPPSHRVGWRWQHGRAVPDRTCETLPDECTLCHTRSSCDDCHRAEKPRNHNNLWRIHGHAAMASMDRQSCRACHTPDSCALCHMESPPRSHRGGWGAPFDRHCLSCHLPLGPSEEQGCGICHRSTPGHDAAPPRPSTPQHMTNDPAVCRACHVPMQHPDNGQNCLFCHR